MKNTKPTDNYNHAYEFIHIICAQIWKNLIIVINVEKKKGNEGYSVIAGIVIAIVIFIVIVIISFILYLMSVSLAAHIYKLLVVNVGGRKLRTTIEQLCEEKGRQL